MTTSLLGPLPPGDVGFYGIDWSMQLGAIAGDQIDGTPTIDWSPADLVISNQAMSGSTQTFNATADKVASYEIVARATFTPSGRVVSQRITLIVGEPPATEPVTLDEARQHLRLDTSGNPPSHPDDALVLGWITAAREFVEQETGLTLVTAAVTDLRDSFEGSAQRHYMGGRYGYAWGYGYYPGEGSFLWDRGHGGGRPSFVLTRAPVISVDSFRYVDTNGDEQTMAESDYRVINDGVLTRLEPALGASWPVAYYGAHGVVQVDYTCGYDPGPVPPALVTAVKMMLAVYYENRSPITIKPLGFDALIDKYRVL